MPELVVLNGVAAGVVFVLGEVPAVVGRSPEAHLIVGDAWISSMHAMFERRGDAIWVVDLDSRNGTWVAGRRVDESRVPDGGVVRLGRTEIRATMSHTTPAGAPHPAPARRREGDHGGLTLSTRNPLVGESEDDPYALSTRAATVLRMALDVSALELVAVGPERVRAALDALEQAALEEGAAVSRLAGVGVLALFGLTGPEQDDPSRALSAARSARRAVRAGGALDLRAAVETGAVLAGHAGGAAGLDLVALGPVAERAERLLALAAPGEILAGPGAATAGLTRVGLVRFGDVEVEVFRDDRV